MQLPQIITLSELTVLSSDLAGQSGGRHCLGATHRLLLPYSHLYGMVIHMKTTLNIEDSVMRRLKGEAARRRCTMSELVESALRLLLEAKEGRRRLPPLPTFDSGGHLVDIADRDALYQAMEGR